MASQRSFGESCDIMSKKGNYETKPFTVLVEGNIASGKTTLLNYFKKYDNVCVLTEPVNMWRNCDGHNLMEYMLKDRERWGFPFQSYAQLTMLQQHAFKTQLPIKLMERSIYSTRYCFIEKLFKDGLLPAPSTFILNEWFKWIKANVDTSVDLIIYLRTSPEVAYARVQNRNRQEEKSMSLTYVTELHEVHENWLYHKTIFSCPAPVLVLNANLDKSLIAEEYERVEPHIFNNCTSVLAS